jgi:hypothetical protein
MKRIGNWLPGLFWFCESGREQLEKAEGNVEGIGFKILLQDGHGHVLMNWYARSLSMIKLILTLLLPESCN